MNTAYMLLALYEKPFLSFQETCEAIGISRQSGYNARSQGTFPVPMLENPLRASIQDVADYIDKQRDLAKEKMGNEHA